MRLSARSSGSESRTAAVMAREADRRSADEWFRQSWHKVYAGAAEFTPDIVEKIVRRMLRLARFIRPRFWDFAIAERLTAEQDFYTDVAVRLLAHAWRGIRPSCGFV